MEYLSVEEARERSGLRLVLSAGVPGPWGEALKAILAVKHIAYLAVRQEPGGENEALRAWTGQTSAPVLVPEEGAPVCHWLDQLHLAERLAPEPSLLSSDPETRAEVIGLSALIAGADGFGWQRRLQLLSPGMQADPRPEGIERMAQKYGWSEQAAADAQGNLAGTCAHLDAVLAAQEKQGSSYFVGDGLTAVDIYWANFAGLIRPLPPEDSPMPEQLRAVYESGGEAVKTCLTPRLLAHRERMYRYHLTLPLDF